MVVADIDPTMWIKQPQTRVCSVNNITALLHHPPTEKKKGENDEEKVKTVIILAHDIYVI